MTPEDFSTQVMPQIVAAWERSCFCQSPGFLKLMSFDFRSYGSGPRVLYDVDLIGAQIIDRRFVKVSEWQDVPRSAGQVSVVACPQCRTKCSRALEQYNAFFWCPWYRFDTAVKMADVALYLTGFYWLGESYATPDFQQAASVEQFLRALTG